MITPDEIVNQLAGNIEIFRAQLRQVTEKMVHWKPSKDKWCVLEVVSHLYDEEREDFRARVQSILQDPNRQLVTFDPLLWVAEHDYIHQDFDVARKRFFKERDFSINWLTNLNSPRWDHTYKHPKLGPISARMMLSNWLAHDYIHIRQINRLFYQYLDSHNECDLSYAGKW